MVFKSEEQLEGFILKKCKAALAETEKKVHRTIDKCLKAYYGEFEPEEYIRTGQLLHSLVKTGVSGSGSGFKAEVYFDAGALNYQTGPIEIKSTPITGRMGYATWGADEVLDTAMNGSHGGYVGGTAIWGKSMTMLGDITALLLKELKAQGISIK